MTKIRVIISDGNNSDWQEVEATNIIVVNIEEYLETKNIDDITIESEGGPIEGVVRVYDSPEAPPFAPKQSKKQPWELF